jgi:hypothetical protein
MSFSALAICCKNGAPWNGTGSASQSECLAYGNVFVQGNSCDGKDIVIRDKCPDGSAPLFVILSPDLEKKCLSSRGYVFYTPARSKLCCIKR